MNPGNDFRLIMIAIVTKTGRSKSRLTQLKSTKLALMRILTFLSFLYAPNILATTEGEFSCGSLNNGYGPFDYRKTTDAERQIVEQHHFTPPVEQLVRGSTASEPGGDLDYTLRAFPNHPRALKSMMELGFRKKTDRPTGTKWPVWCYFERAIRFKPNDAQVRMVYAMYLQRKGKTKEALKQLQEAQALVEDSANIHYNLGLIYLDLGDYENSLAHAHKAYKLGFPLEGLRNRLKRANKWRDPASESAKPNSDQNKEVPAISPPSSPE